MSSLILDTVSRFKSQLQAQESLINHLKNLPTLTSSSCAPLQSRHEELIQLNEKVCLAFKQREYNQLAHFHDMTSAFKKLTSQTEELLASYVPDEEGHEADNPHNTPGPKAIKKCKILMPFQTTIPSSILSFHIFPFFALQDLANLKIVSRNFHQVSISSMQTNRKSLVQRYAKDITFAIKQFEIQADQNNAPELAELLSYLSKDTEVWVHNRYTFTIGDISAFACQEYSTDELHNAIHAYRLKIYQEDQLNGSVDTDQLHICTQIKSTTLTALNNDQNYLKTISQQINTVFSHLFHKKTLYGHHLFTWLNETINLYNKMQSYILEDELPQYIDNLYRSGQRHLALAICQLNADSRCDYWGDIETDVEINKFAFNIFKQIKQQQDPLAQIEVATALYYRDRLKAYSHLHRFTTVEEYAQAIVTIEEFIRRGEVVVVSKFFLHLVQIELDKNNINKSIFFINQFLDHQYIVKARNILNKKLATMLDINAASQDIQLLRQAIERTVLLLQQAEQSQHRDLFYISGSDTEEGEFDEVHEYNDESFADINDRGELRCFAPIRAGHGMD